MSPRRVSFSREPHSCERCPIVGPLSNSKNYCQLFKWYCRRIALAVHTAIIKIIMRCNVVTRCYKCYAQRYEKEAKESGNERTLLAKINDQRFRHHHCQPSIIPLLWWPLYYDDDIVDVLSGMTNNRSRWRLLEDSYVMLSRVPLLNAPSHRHCLRLALLYDVTLIKICKW